MFIKLSVLIFTTSSEFYHLILLKLEGKVQELQSRLDAELDARDRISQSSQSVQSKITQQEKQIHELTEQLRVETDTHTKNKKLYSDLQKVCVILKVRMRGNKFSTIIQHVDVLFSLN